MNRQRLFRGLRIAISAVCGLMCLLLVVLWLRSYWWVDGFWWNGTSNSYFLSSTQGGINYARTNGTVGAETWRIASDAIDPLIDGEPIFLRPVFEVFWGEPGYDQVSIAYWVPTMFFAVATAAMGVRRFSLRALLIVTRVVALLLGLAAYLTKA
jgi:hypothetical protein